MATAQEVILNFAMGDRTNIPYDPPINLQEVHEEIAPAS